jgi:hypothetical protein
LFRRSGVPGAVLTDALASRFDVHIEVTTNFALAEHLGVPRAVTAAISLNQDLAAGKTTRAPQPCELLSFTRIRRSLGLPVADSAGGAANDERSQVIAALSAAFGTPVTAPTLGKQR